MPWAVKRTCSAHAPAGAGAVRKLAAANAVTTGARVTLAHIQPCRDGANGFVAAVRWALNAVVRHVQPVIIGFLLTYLAYLVAARAVSTADTTVRVMPGFAVPRVFARHDLNWLHDSEAYVVGAGAARQLGVSTPIGPLAATVSSRRASLLPAAWAPPPAPAQALCSSSCAFPASSMSPGGCTISRLTRWSLLATHWSAASRPTATTHQAGGAPIRPEQRSPTTCRTRPTRTRSPAASLSPRAACPATRPLARSRQASWRAGTARPAARPLARSR